MKCILHIGTEKTGTSTIQAFLDLNRSVLRAHRILCPESGGRRNNRGLSVAAYNLTNLDDYVKSIGIRNAEQLSKHQSQIIDSLRMEIAQAETDGIEVVCFSSEHLHSRLRTDEEVERLRKILGSLGFSEISVIIYLREQADLVASIYGTAVLSGGRTTLPPEPGSEEYWNNLCDHAESLRRFRRVFAAESVKPRLFSKEEFVGDSLITDFLSAAGIDLPIDQLRFPERENESISSFGLEVLRRLNARQPRFHDDGSINPVRSGDHRFFQSAFKYGRKFTLSPEMVTKYQAAYEESNDWVRSEYFPGREKLFPPKRHDAEQFIERDHHEFDEVAALIEILLVEKARVHAANSVRRVPEKLWQKVHRKLGSFTKRFIPRR